MTNVSTMEIAANVLSRLATGAADRAQRRQQTGLARTWFQSVSRSVLQIVGFACLTVAGFMWDNVAGMIVAGVSCFALSTLLTTKPQNPPIPPAPRLR